MGIRHLHQPTIGYLILNPPSLPPSHPATAGNQDNDNRNYNNDRSGGARPCRCDGHQDADLGRRNCLLLVLLTTPFAAAASAAAAYVLSMSLLSVNALPSCVVACICHHLGDC